jgi:FkbM family methyltransferase
MLKGVRKWTQGKAMGLRSLARIAPHLREPVRFCTRQITRRTGLRAYRLRGSDVRILVRHSTGDLITLEEVLAERQYEPPAHLNGLFELGGSPLSVADLGANIGLFSAWLMSRRPDAAIVAFEPDPANAAVLEECMRVNGRDAARTVVRAAAATEPGELRFLAGELAASRQVEDGGIAVPAVDVFPYLEGRDFVKIDIEGGEWPILSDARFRNVGARALVLEYHPHLCPEPEPRACAESLLTGAGWTIQHMDFDMPPGHGVLWAWR